MNSGRQIVLISAWAQNNLLKCSLQAHGYGLAQHFLHSYLPAVAAVAEMLHNIGVKSGGELYLRALRLWAATAWCQQSFYSFRWEQVGKRFTPDFVNEGRSVFGRRQGIGIGQGCRL